MANASVSGLVSGLDTASIVDQLMQLEAAPQNRLKSQQDAQKKVVSSLQALNTDTALLASRAAALAKPSAWQTLKPTSSNPLVTVSGTPTSAASFSVTVNQVATAGQTVYASATALDASVTSGTVTLHTPDNKDLLVPGTDTGTLTLKDLAAAINGMKAGVTATTVRTGTDATTGAGTYRLLLSSDKTGLGDPITLTNVAALGAEDARAGQDAKISIGAQGIVATSSTNTFTDIVPGVSLTVSANSVGSLNPPLGATVTTSSITVAQDTAGVKSGLSSLVDQLNKMLTSIDAATAGATSTTAAGILAGDTTARSLRDSLAESVFGDGTVSLASVGIQTDRYGKFVFDGDAFDKAYAADPAGTAAKFTSGASTATDGWLARVATVAKAASDATTGTLTQAITGRNSTISEMDKNIAAWDLRLELRRTSLQQTYTALETAMSTMQSQGTWLAGQIAQLPKSS